MRAIVTIGVSGCGASSWASYFEYQNYPHWVNISRKAGRLAVSDRAELDKEALVTQWCKDAIVAAAFSGKGVVISDTNLNPVSRRAVLKRLKRLGYEIEIKEFPISYENFIEKCQSKGVLSERTMMLQWVQWQDYMKEKNERV